MSWFDDVKAAFGIEDPRGNFGTTRKKAAKAAAASVGGGDARTRATAAQVRDTPAQIMAKIAQLGQVAQQQQATVVKAPDLTGLGAPDLTGLGGPAAPAAPSQLDQLMGSIPGLNLTDYTSPYDQAADTAHDVYGKTKPEIAALYASLRDELGKGQVDAQGAMSANRQALVDQLARSRGELQGFADQAAAGPHVQTDSLRAAGVADTAARAAAQAQTGDSRLALQDRFAQIQQQSSDSRSSDSQLAESSAQSNAATNLQQILNKLGMGRAEATQQFSKDSSSQAMGMAKMAHDDELLRSKERIAMLEGAQTTPRDEFEALVSSGDVGGDALKAFQAIAASAKGTGPLAYAKAKEGLEASRKDLESGKNDWGKRFDVDKIDSWLKAYYDNKTKTVSPRKLAEAQAIQGG